MQSKNKFTLYVSTVYYARMQYMFIFNHLFIIFINILIIDIKIDVHIYRYQ